MIWALLILQTTAPDPASNIYVTIAQLGALGGVLVLLLTQRGLHTTGELTAVKQQNEILASQLKVEREEKLGLRTDLITLQTTTIEDIIPAITRMNDHNTQILAILSRRSHGNGS